MQPTAGETNVIGAQNPNRTAGQDLQKMIREIQADVQREIQRDARAGGEAAATTQTPPTSPHPVFEADPMAGRLPRRPDDGRQVFVGGTEVPWRGRDDIPPQAVEMAIGFFFTVVAIVIGLPIARAFARRMDRKAVAPQIPPELTAQLGQLTQAVDAIALEVERISEGQRFATRLLAEQRDSARQTLSAGSNR